MAVFKSAFAGGTRNQGQGGGVASRQPCGIDWLHFSVNVPTTAIDSNDEQILLYKFPDDGDCWLFRGGSNTTTAPIKGADFSISLTAMDPVGTALVWSLGLSDADGVLDTTLISGGTAGQAAGVDYITTADEPLDVSGKYLCWDVTTAAGTAVAGTITIRAKVAFGKKLEVDTGVA
jgi:hypothetical protein